MRQVDMILLAMKSDISKKAYNKLAQVLEEVLLPSHCNKDDSSLIEAFLEHCKFANYSEQTIALYQRELNSLVKNSELPLLDLSHREIKVYLDKCRKQCKARTVAHKLSIISSFYSYLILEEWIQFNPCAKVPRIRIPQEQKKGITDVELAKAMEFIDNDRDIAIIEFFRSTGCRISEVCKLQVGDVDFNNHTAFIRQAKGHKDRTVSFDSQCERYLKLYLKPFTHRDADEPFFLQKARGGATLQYLYVMKPITTSSVKQWFSKIQEISGVKNFHAHALRHYCITKLLSNKMPLKLVSLQAGHSSSSTTLDIYDDVTLEEMQFEYAKAMN